MDCVSPGRARRDFLRVLLAACVLLGIVPSSTLGMVWVSDEHTWGVETSVEEGTFVEYLLCDLEGENCEPLASGDPSLAGNSLALCAESDPNSVFALAACGVLDPNAPSVVVGEGFESGRLRARICAGALDGNTTPSCGPESEAGPPFRVDSRLIPFWALSVPALLDEGTKVLEEGLPLVVPLEIALAPPFDAWFQMSLLTPGGSVRLELRGEDPNKPLLGEERTVSWDDMAFLDLREDLTEAFRQGHREIVVVLWVIEGPVKIGWGDPLASPFPAPHLEFQSRRPGLLDTDEDGVPDDGDDSGSADDWPCESGRWLACDDSCPSVANFEQVDEDEDGAGDVCDNCREGANPRISPAPAYHRTTGGQIDDDLDGVGNRCDASFTAEGDVVGESDLWLMAGALGHDVGAESCPAGPDGVTGSCSRFDLSGNGGSVNIEDLLVLLELFGTRPSDLGCAPDAGGAGRCPLECEAGPGALPCP